MKPCAKHINTSLKMKVVISGYGKMGHIVEEVLAERGIECIGKSDDISSFPDDLAADAVCIDFTNPDAFKANYTALAAKFKAVVVGTTGWYDIAGKVFDCFRENGTTMIYASNFSIGVNVTFAIAQLAARKLSGAGYKADIVETHHIHKLDAPSGTAKSIAAIVENEKGYGKVDIESRRIGEVPGIHTLTFTGDCDRITVTHEAFSRKGFAIGAVQAALMTEGLDGIHEFKDLILEKI